LSSIKQILVNVKLALNSIYNEDDDGKPRTKEAKKMTKDAKERIEQLNVKN